MRSESLSSHSAKWLLRLSVSEVLRDRTAETFATLHCLRPTKSLWGARNFRRTFKTFGRLADRYNDHVVSVGDKTIAQPDHKPPEAT